MNSIVESINTLDSTVTENYTETNQRINTLKGSVDDLRTQLASPFTYKGTVASISNLPSSNNVINDTYFVEDQNCLYSWNGTAWNQSSYDADGYAQDLADLKSAFEDMIVVTVGDNLTNPAELYVATIDNATGAINKPDNYYVCSGHIPCTPGETLYILWRVSDNDIRVRKTNNDKIAFYRQDGSFISIGFNADSYVVPPQTAYCVQQGYKAVTEENNVAVFRIPASALDGRWVYYHETKTLKDSYTPTEVTEQLNSLGEYVKKDELLDYSVVNRLDPSKCEVGKIININTGSLIDNSSYFTTDFMEIRPGETLWLLNKNGNTNGYVNRFAAFDKDKNILPSLSAVSSNPYFVQNGNMAYIRVSVIYYADDYYRTPNGVACLANQHPYFVPGFGGGPTIYPKYLRPVINVKATDTEAEVITKLIDAYNTTSCDVYFERSNYAFGAELEKINIDYGMSVNEIPIGNGCRYFFNGSVLTATVNLSQHPSTGDEEFYCNFFGCQRLPSSYELHDGVLIATDTRYIVHDESTGLSGSYKHLYQNMEMHYHTNARQEAIRKCIGGGTGENGVVEIVGCKFTTDGSDSCVSYHGNGTDISGATFDLNVRNSWFSNNIRGGVLSTSQTARLFYSGNSAASAPTTYDRWTVTAFQNEVRD